MEDKDDAAFLRAFVSCRLPRPEWTHEAHVRMAYLHLRGDGATLADVLPVVRQRIRALNLSYGNPAGYHETVTAAFLCLIHARMNADAPAAASWPVFRDAHPDLLDRYHPILLRHYTHDRLYSPEARAAFVAPDLLALPASGAAGDGGETV